MMRRRMQAQHPDSDEYFDQLPIQPVAKPGRSWKFYLIIVIIVLVLAGLGFWWWKRRGSSSVSSSSGESCSVDSIDLHSLDGL
jgi:hypothetical protein